MLIIKKKLFCLIIILALIISVSGCTEPTDKVLNSLGKYKAKQYYSHGEFQDFTDYAKYVFEDVNFENNKYLKKITKSSKKDLLLHIEDFEMWVNCFKKSDPNHELVTGYDFNTSLISKNDYLYIYDNPSYDDLGCYDVYFFNIETMTLYYFHNSI